MSGRGTSRPKSGRPGGKPGGDPGTDSAERKPRAAVKPLAQLNAEMAEHESEARDIVADLTPRDLTARLFRSHPKLPGGEAFVDEFPAHLADQSYIAKNYGGGAYRVEIYGLSNKGRDRPARGKLRQESFTVDLSIPPKNPAEELGPVVRQTANGARPPDQEPAREAQPAAPVIAPADAINAALQGSVISMFRTMQELGHLQTSMVERLVARPPERPTIEWGEVAKVAVPAVVTLVTALLGRKDNSVSQAKEMLALMQAANPPAARRSAAEELREALALVDELRGAAGETGEPSPNAVPWWGDLAKAGAQLVAGMAAQREEGQGQPSPGLAPQPAAPAQIGAGAAPAVEVFPSPALPTQSLETAPELMNPLVTHLKPFAPHLAQWAREGRPPEWAAETLLFEIPAGLHDFLLPRLQEPAMIPELVQALPVLVPYEPWLQSVRLALLDQMAGDDSGEEPNAE